MPQRGLAQLERSIVRERVQSGIVLARLHRTNSGRPIGRPRIAFDQPREAEDLRGHGAVIDGAVVVMGRDVDLQRKGCAEGLPVSASPKWLFGLPRVPEAVRTSVCASHSRSVATLLSRYQTATAEALPTRSALLARG